MRFRFLARLTLAAILLGGIGGLLTIALLTVLGVGLFTAGGNTLALLRDQADQTIESIANLTRLHLLPAEANVGYVAQMVAGIPRIGPQEAEWIRLSMAAAPQIRGVVLAMGDGTLVRVGRDGEYLVDDWSAIGITADSYRQALEHKGMTWGQPAWAEEINSVIIPVRHPIVRAGAIVGVANAGITAHDLSRFLNEATGGNGTAFILDGYNRVIAHSNLLSSPHHPDRHGALPRPDEVNDAALAGWVAGRAYDVGRFSGAHDVQSGLVDTPSGQYIVLMRPMSGVDPQSWTVGTSLPTGTAAVFFERLETMLIAGIVVLSVALLLLFFLARAIRRPIDALAVASERVRRLELDPPPEMPATSIAELQEASQAFDRMAGALKWFETYVPRRLVFRLMRDGTDAGLATRQRSVTVLFTDIAGFTTLSETKDAAQVAALLNEHFSLLATCIEDEDGTIDKYIGDSVMAYWGAPARQDDHAARACRAVAAIAKVIAKDNARRRAAGEPPIRIRIGLHSGDVTAGNIGAPGRINYTVIGDVVNVSNRIEQICKEIDPDAEVIAVATSVTVEEAGLAATAEPVGQRALRGRSEPLRLYRLV